MKGEISLQGETSLDDALLDQPGDCRDSSEAMLEDRFVVDDDLTMDLSSGDSGRLVLRIALLEIEDVTRGLGVLGRTDILGVTGRLLGDLRGKDEDLDSRGPFSESSELNENLGSAAPSLLWSFLLRWSRGENSSGSVRPDSGMEADACKTVCTDKGIFPGFWSKISSARFGIFDRAIIFSRSGQERCPADLPPLSVADSGFWNGKMNDFDDELLPSQLTPCW